MTSRRTSLRLALSTGIAALMLIIAGTLSPASAATATWMYMNDLGQPCLTSSTASSNIWVQYSCSGNGATTWHWGSETNSWQGHTMRRLVSNASGDCLTTDYGADTNNVYGAPCGGGRTGQFWTADNDQIQNQNTNYLRTSDSGDGVFTSPKSVIADYGINETRFVWWGFLL
ncbi:RICIN domain-containing protein [Streptomyces sp. NBC_00828]|uniref:hypothetical protein n=1 Tax=Streptomyces sp. NBC_00828 TaxID=2903678 RepID=UPI003864DF3A